MKSFPVAHVRKVILFLILIMFACARESVHAQQATEDSLQAAFLNAREDIAKRNCLEELMFFYLSNNTKSKDESFRQLQSLVQKKGDPKLNYRLFLFRVVLTHTTDSIIETRKCINEFLEQCRRIDNKKDYVAALMLKNM